MHVKLLASDENHVAYIFLIWGNVTTSQINATGYHSYCFTLTLPSETRWKKITNYFRAHWGIQSYSTSDFHCPPSANIISASLTLIADMDGTNSSNSFRILRYPSEVVVKLSIGKDCFCANLLAYVCTGYCSMSVICMAIFYFLNLVLHTMVTCDLFIPQVESMLFVSDTSG